MKRFVIVALLIAGWIILLFLRPSFGIAEDFHPIIHAAHRLLQAKSVYNTSAVEELRQQWPSPHATSGFIYPLPLALLVAPLTVVPLWLAVGIWLVIGVAGTYAVILLRSDWQALLPLPLLFMPFWDAVYARQVTLVWFAIIVGMLFAMRHRNALVVGIAVALLPIKPQIGIFFALYALVWSWKHMRPAIGWAVVFGVLVWGGSLLADPNWPIEWLGVLGRHRIMNPSSPLYILLVPLLIVTWHMPWSARIAALQIGAFQLTGVYTLLPLLLIWTAIGGRRALVGAGISWVFLLFMTTSSAPVVVACMLVPLLVCAYLDRVDHRSSRHTNDPATSIAVS